MGRRKGEGAECSVTVIARVLRKINLIYGRSIQKSDWRKELKKKAGGQKDELVEQSMGRKVGVRGQRFIV